MLPLASSSLFGLGFKVSGADVHKVHADYTELGVEP